MAHAQTEPEVKGLTVISESNTNPGVRTVQVGRPPMEEASYITAAIKGLGITLSHFGKNIVKNVTGRRASSMIETINYPEETIPYPERNRGLHRLMQRDDGHVRCVACMCCPTVCPADCITIIPAETDDAGIEKYPARFEIDELRCVVCGLCVEACPCDAIRMDTGMHAMPTETRAEAIMTKEKMLNLGAKSIAVQGGDGPDWREDD